VVVVERSPGSHLYKYAVSTVGALVALGAFFQYWSIDFETATFLRRSGR
jgi:hypothetical protein